MIIHGIKIIAQLFFKGTDLCVVCLLSSAFPRIRRCCRTAQLYRHFLLQSFSAVAILTLDWHSCTVQAFLYIVFSCCSFHFSLALILWHCSVCWLQEKNRLKPSGLQEFLLKTFQCSGTLPSRSFNAPIAIQLYGLGSSGINKYLVLCSKKKKKTLPFFLFLRGTRIAAWQLSSYSIPKSGFMWNSKLLVHIVADGQGWESGRSNSQKTRS